MWAQRLRLWSAIVVCSLAVLVGFPCFVAGDYALRLWRDIRLWRWRRRGFP